MTDIYTDFEEAVQSGQLIDVWKMSDILLDIRNQLKEEDKPKVDQIFKDLGIQKEGPSVIMDKSAKEMLERLKKET